MQIRLQSAEAGDEADLHIGNELRHKPRCEKGTTALRKSQRNQFQENDFHSRIDFVAFCHPSGREGRHFDANDQRLPNDQS